MKDENGYYEKFIVWGGRLVRSKDLTPVDKVFILNLETDQVARDTAIYYAIRTGNQKLQADLVKLFDDLGPIKDKT